MKMKKNALAGTIAAGLIAGAGATVSSNAVAFDPSVGAGLEVSNMYLWRGVDLGAPSGGLAMVAGSLEIDSGVGFYAGTWAASGDGGAGQEYDLYAGYAFDVTDEITVDLGVINYIYPDQDKDNEQDGFADFSEAYVSVSGYGFGAEYYNNIAGGADGLSGYDYFNISYGYGPFGIAIGQHNFDSAAQGGDFGEDMTHLDLTYQFNDEISFTASTIVDVDDDDATRKTTLVQAMYTKSFDLY